MTRTPDTAPKTITRRHGDYRRNADVIGWHIHTQDNYVGYNDVLTMDAIARQFANAGLRLVYVQGNVLTFCA